MYITIETLTFIHLSSVQCLLYGFRHTSAIHYDNSSKMHHHRTRYHSWDFMLHKLNDSDGLLTQVKLIDKSEQGHCKSSHGIFILIVRAEHFTFLKATKFSHNSKKNGK